MVQNAIDFYYKIWFIDLSWKGNENIETLPKKVTLAQIFKVTLAQIFYSEYQCALLYCQVQ